MFFVALKLTLKSICTIYTYFGSCPQTEPAVKPLFVLAVVALYL